MREIAAQLGASLTRVRYWIEKYDLGPTGPRRRAILVGAARDAGLQELELDCPRHGQTAFKILRPSGVRCKRCNSRGVAERRRRVKKILVEEAGGRCQICGYDRYPGALEFHHLDPSQKKFALAQAGITKSIASARDEAAKCTLLCSNCHAEVEAGFADPALRLTRPVPVRDTS